MPISNKKLLLQRFSLFSLIVLLAALFIGGHQPESGRVFPAPWDKLAHFILYGLLAVMTGISFPKSKLIITLLFILTIGCADEIHQIFVPGRHPELGDLTADIIGGLSGLFIVSKQRNRLFRND